MPTATIEKRLTENEIIKQNERLIHYLLRPYRKRKDYEDLFQEAAAAFVKAIRTYDPASAVKLSSYAYRVMKNRIKNLMATESRVKRNSGINPRSLDKPLPGREKITVLDVLPDRQRSFEELTEARVIWDQIFESDRLTNLEKRVLKLYCSGFVLSEIAKKIGVSHQHASQICRRARSKCRLILKN